MKLLASDFDNTLLFHNQMKLRDVKAIKKFQKNGHLFGLCTGRSLEGIERPSQPYHIHYDFYILLSGALILNKNKDVILEKTIPMSLVMEIFDFLNQQDASVIYKNEMYKVYHKKTDDKRGTYLHSFLELDADEVNAFSFHFQDNEIDKATKATAMINEKFGDYIEAYQNNQHIDLAAKGCSKGHGLQIIRDYFQLDEQQIYAIGDSWNDLPMLDSVINSYTFTYAHPDVQKHAQTIVKTLADCIQDIEEKD